MAKSHKRKVVKVHKGREHTQAEVCKRVKTEEQPKQVPRLIGASANLPDFHTFKTVSEMRAGLTLLDLTFPHSKQHVKTGKWHSFSCDDLETIYSGRKRHMEAHIKTAEWHANRKQVLLQRINTYVRTYVFVRVLYTDPRAVETVSTNTLHTYVPDFVVHIQTVIRTYVRTYVVL